MYRCTYVHMYAVWLYSSAVTQNDHLVVQSHSCAVILMLIVSRIFSRDYNRIVMVVIAVQLYVSIAASLRRRQPYSYMAASRVVAQPYHSTAIWRQNSVVAQPYHSTAIWRQNSVAVQPYHSSTAIWQYSCIDT